MTLRHSLHTRCDTCAHKQALVQTRSHWWATTGCCYSSTSSTIPFETVNVMKGKTKQKTETETPAEAQKRDWIHAGTDGTALRLLGYLASSKKEKSPAQDSASISINKHPFKTLKSAINLSVQVNRISRVNSASKIQHKFIKKSAQQRETGSAARNLGQDRAQRGDFHMATGVCWSFCGKQTLQFCTSKQRLKQLTWLKMFQFYI